MQIGSANLLALQQASQNKQAAPQPQAPAFDAALAQTGDGFEPLKFAESASAQTPSDAAPQVTKAQPYGQAQLPGSQVDIRV